MNKLKLLFLFSFLFGTGSLLISQNQNALDFDGVNDYVNLGQPSVLDFDPDADVLSASVWFRMESGKTGSFLSKANGEGSTNHQFQIGYADTDVVFAEIGGVRIDGTTAYDDYIWHHACVTSDGSAFQLYVDGTLENSGVPGATTNSTDWMIAARRDGVNSGSDFPFNGQLDEVRIWDVELTLTQIKDNMYREVPDPTSETNLIAYYMFSETSGTTLPDESANSNDGTLINFLTPTWVSSTAPIPYYSRIDGNWATNNTWEHGQNAPANDWARVMIYDAVTASSDETAEDITIATTGSFTVASTYTVAVNNDFLIESDNTGTGSFIDNGTFSATNGTMERYYDGYEWHFISSPVSGAVSGLFTGLYLQTHNEGTNLYTDIIPTNIPLAVMKGYALWNNSSATASFSGTFFTGSQSIALSKTNLGWNLVGNPYPSSIDWDAASGWTKTNANNATYIHVDNATWASYVGGVGANGGTKFIAPGQGFFVECSTNPGTLGMTNAVRAHNATTFFKESVSNMVRIELSGNDYADETVVRFAGEASAEFDGDFDARKLFGSIEEAGQIYSSGEDRLSINSLPQTENVSLGVKTGVSGIYTIAATEINDIPNIYLIDNVTSETTNLKEKSYSFQSEIGEIDDRFVLHFGPMAVNDQMVVDASIYSSNGQVYIKLNENKQATYQVFNVTGQIIQEGSVNQGQNVLNINASGTLIVRVIAESGVLSEKVWLK